MPDFRVRVAGDDLAFHAAHFITLENGACERLHGHTFHVAVEASGPLNESRYVADFVAFRAVLKTLVGELDHRVLLPERHPTLRLSSHRGEIEATLDGRRWVFPEEDCLRLPVANTTTESLAEYVAGRVAAALPPSVRLRVEIDEGSGCAAVCEAATRPADRP